MNFIDRFIRPVSAHCDIPCGIYEVDAMRNAAATCLRMCEKIEALAGEQHGKSDDHNNFIRMVMNKERHAQTCKEQIYMLWSDFFKPEHLETHTDIHDKIWQAAKQCSKVKQTISKDEAQKLVDMVDGIAHLVTDIKEQSK